MAVPKKKAAVRVRVTQSELARVRSEKKNPGPSWAGHEDWSKDQFSRTFHNSLQYYHTKIPSKDCKSHVLTWMKADGYPKAIQKLFSHSPDWRVSPTMAAIANVLISGMPAIREDFNNGRDTGEWLRTAILEVIENSKDDKTAEVNSESTRTVSIQDRVREAAAQAVSVFDEAIEDFLINPSRFDFSSIDIMHRLKSRGMKPAHARHIVNFYQPAYNELLELASGTQDEDLLEGYKFLSRRNVKKLMAFYKAIIDNSRLLQDEIKAAKKLPEKAVVKRILDKVPTHKVTSAAKKPTKPTTAAPKSKLVANLKYLKAEPSVNVSSINPESVIGARELWCYDIRTRKLVRYVAADDQGLTVYRSSIANFDPEKSTSKMLKSPNTQLAELKVASKVDLRRFMDSIKTVAVKPNGKVTDNHLLLRVV